MPHRRPGAKIPGELRFRISLCDAIILWGLVGRQYESWKRIALQIKFDLLIDPLQRCIGIFPCAQHATQLARQGEPLVRRALTGHMPLRFVVARPDETSERNRGLSANMTLLCGIANHMHGLLDGLKAVRAHVLVEIQQRQEIIAEETV